MTWALPLPVLPDGRRPVVTSGFAVPSRPKHYGVDLAYPARDGDPAWPGRATLERTRRYFSPAVPVAAVAAGTVIEAHGPDWHPRIRGRVRLRHGDGSATVYYHLARVDVQDGDSVQAGQQLGISGAAGDYPFRHLHLELYPAGVIHTNGRQSDPTAMLRAAGVVAPSSGPSSAPGSSPVLLVALFVALFLGGLRA